jgi:hypothetical protein
MTDRLYLYDTTLRDGAQTQGVQFTTSDKARIAAVLDALGLDYIEGGWPGANPTDSDFFREAPRTRATMTAFGMTKRQGRSASNDDVLAAVLDAGTPAVTLVGKTHPFHVTTALGIPLEENLDNIRASLRPSKGQVRGGIFDAEHFFDGFRPTPPTRWPASTPRTRGRPLDRPLRHQRRHAAGRGPRDVRTGHRHPASPAPSGHPHPRRHRPRRRQLARRRGGRRPPDPGHPQRPGRALRQAPTSSP